MKSSNIGVLQLILFLAIFFVPDGQAMICIWLLVATFLFEMALVFLLQWFKMRAIKAGDVVRLKSGGPKMVAEYLNDGNGWLCHWFDKSGTRQSMYCRATMLNRA